MSQKLETRLAEVERRLSEFQSDTQIIDECARNFRSSRRVIVRYIELARARQSRNADSATKRAEIIAAYERIFRECMAENPPQRRTALQALDSLCRIYGLNEAQRLEVLHGIDPRGALMGPVAIIEQLRELEQHPLEVPATEPKKN